MFLNTDEGKLAINGLLSDLGLSDLGPEQKAKFVDTYERLVDAEMKMLLAAELTDKEMMQVEALGDDYDAITSHINDNIGINLTLVLVGAMQKVKEQLISDVSYVRARMDMQQNNSAE